MGLELRLLARTDDQLGTGRAPDDDREARPARSFDPIARALIGDDRSIQGFGLNNVNNAQGSTNVNNAQEGCC